MKNFETIPARIIKGELFKYLEGVDIVGRHDLKSGEFYIHGCLVGQEKKFYQGILNWDKDFNYIGLKDIDAVEEFWLNGCDGMRLGVPSGDVCQVEPTYEYKGERYIMNYENKELKVGTILYDEIIENFFEIENDEDLERYLNMDTELYRVLEETDEPTVNVNTEGE